MDIDPEAVAGTVIVFVFGTVYHAVGNEEPETRNQKRDARLPTYQLTYLRTGRTAWPLCALRIRVRPQS